MSEPARCGPFHLVRRLARGGMAEVWAAEHRGTPVALKFVSVKGTRAKALFADEIRAHASLMHPHVLQVLDMGTLEKAVDRGPKSGTLWLAMEYASGGDLTRFVRHMTWPEVFIVLAAVLDALSHAHSHGVIHRDLKAANILLATEADVRPGVKLADFGIAHIEDTLTADSLTASQVMGSPTSLAPEQCRGAFREIGPWTDLYALGCLAYRLLQGRWPFEGLPMAASIHAHMNREPPALAPKFSVPDGVFRWIAKLMKKAPQNRYWTASDALRDLWLLGAPPPPRIGALVATRTQLLPLLQSRWPSASEHSTTGWRRPASPPPSRPLIDAGMGLFAVRARKPVGHEALRDQLWVALQECIDERRGSAILLHGPTGSGVSHLGSWMANTALQEGVAEAFTLYGLPEDRPTDAMIRGLERALSVQGLAPPNVRRGIEANMVLHGQHDPWLVDVLVQILEARGGEVAAVGEALQRVLLGRMHGRAGLVWIDDAERAPEVARWAMESLETLEGVPLLFVLGTSGDPRGLPAGSQRCAIEPLKLPEFRNLCRSMLPMDTSLENDLFRHTSGLSGRAVGILQTLARSQALVVSSSGYRSTVPVGSLRDEDAVLGFELASLPEPQARALTRAALFGTWVPLDPWATACDDPRGSLGTYHVPIGGMLARHELLERLKNAGLAVEEGTRWRFTRPGLGATILTQAEDAGLLLEARSDTAEALQRHRTQLLHAARLLRDAGRAQDALDLYLEATDVRLSSDQRGAEPETGAVAALDLMDRLGVSPADDRRQWLHALRLVPMAENPAATGEVRALMHEAQTHHWHAVEAHTATVLERMVGEDRTEQAQRALALAPPSLAAAMARINLSVTVARKHRYRLALEISEPLLPLSELLGIDWIRTTAEANMGEYQRILGRPLGIEYCIHQAENASKDGRFQTAAVWWINAAEEAYAAKDYDLSDEANLKALSGMAYCTMSAVVPLCNLSVNAFERRDGERMRHFLDRAWHSGPGHSMATVFEVLELCWASLTRDASTIENRLRRLEKRTESTPLAGPQTVALLKQVASGIRETWEEWAHRIEDLPGMPSQ